MDCAHNGQIIIKADFIMKRLIIGFVILIVLLAGGFTTAIMTLNSIDWSEYEEPIVSAVRDVTGREMHFSGSLKVNIGLSPSISANGVTLQNAEWADRNEMLSLKHAEAHLKLLPLIYGQVELSRLEIIGLDILLETNQLGKGNWEFGLAGGDQPAANNSEPVPISDEEDLLSGAFLKKAVIKNSTIEYKHGMTGESQRLSIEKFTAKMDSASAPLVIDLQATHDTEPVALAGKIAGITGLLADKPLELDLTVKMMGATLAVEGTIEKPLEADGIEMAVNMSGDSMSRLAEAAGETVSDFGAYDINATVVGNTETIAILDIVAGLEAAGATIKVTGAVQDMISQQGIDVVISAKGPSLSALIGLAKSDAPDSGAFSVTANITGANNQFKVANLQISFADMQIDGKLTANVADEPLQLEATLHSPRIDLNRLLPTDDSAESFSTDMTSEQPGGANKRVFSDDPLPIAVLDALDSIDALVTLSIGELILDPEMMLTNLDTVIHAASDKISFTPIKLNVMGATIDGHVGLEVLDKAAVVTARLNVQHPNFGDLVEDGGDTMMSGGPLDLDVDVTGNGASIRYIMASLNGSLAAELGAARINNKWLQRAIADVRAIRKKPAENKPIDLNCVITQFSIKDGIAVSDSLVIDARRGSLFGNGRINLRNESLHLDFDMLASNIRASTVLPSFRLRGTLASPTGGVDAGALAGKILGFDAGQADQNNAESPDVSAQIGPERCRQRLVVYEQVQADRTRLKENPIEAAGKAAEATKEIFEKLGGFFKKKTKKQQGP